jgi:hypothetical protein
VTKKLPSLEEFREISQNPVSAEARDLIRSGQWDELAKASRREEAIAKVKAERPGITDEEAREVEARYPVDSAGWPEALATWVERQVKNKKKSTDLRRRSLLMIANYIRENFELVTDLCNPGDEERILELMVGAYFIGVYCPAPDEGLSKVAKALEKTKGRPKPKWNAVADDLLLRTPGLPPSADGRANKIRPDLVRVLAEKEPRKKPPSVRTLRDYIGQVGKKRT